MIPEAARWSSVTAMHEVPVNLVGATVTTPSIDDGSAGWTTPGRAPVIPEAAVEAAVEAHCEGTMLAALEAAYPILAAQVLREAVEAFPLETITSPDNAVMWLRRRADEMRAK